MIEKKYTILWWSLLLSLVLAAAIPLIPWEALAASAEAPAPVLIIDAGHGGADRGAQASDGTLESGINLDIALRLEAAAVFFGVETVMTRASEEIEYPAEADTIARMKIADQHARAELISSFPDAVLLSIHQNYYPASAPWGIQVFYNSVPGGDLFADILQGNLTAQLCPENRRIAEKADNAIYLMKQSGHPAALVECGFLSNPGDLEKLESAGYRTQLAVVMLASYLQYTSGVTA